MARKAKTTSTKKDSTAICGIEGDIGKEHADTFSSVQHPDLRADWQMSNAEVRMWN